MKDKITAHSFDQIIIPNPDKNKPSKKAIECYELHQQSLQQILEEAGEELPNKDKVTDSADKYSDNLKLENRLLESQAFEGHIAGAEWMRSEASKVVAKLKEEVKDKIAGWERCAKALDATSEDLNRCRAEIQQLKEELARKENEPTEFLKWIAKNKWFYEHSYWKKYIPTTPGQGDYYSAIHEDQLYQLYQASKTDKP